MSEKKHPEMGKFRTLVFQCDDCGKILETTNSSWTEDIPDICPKCGKGKFDEISVAPTNFFDRTRERDWDKELSTEDQARVLNNEIDPY